MSNSSSTTSTRKRGEIPVIGENHANLLVVPRGNLNTLAKATGRRPTTQVSSRTGPRWWAHSRRHLHGHGQAFARQLNGHDCSTSGRTRDADRAVVRLDEAPDRGQAQTGSAHFGGEERREDLLQHVRRNARALISK